MNDGRGRHCWLGQLARLVYVPRTTVTGYVRPTDHRHRPTRAAGGLCLPFQISFTVTDPMRVWTCSTKSTHAADYTPSHSKLHFILAGYLVSCEI